MCFILYINHLALSEHRGMHFRITIEGEFLIEEFLHYNPTLINHISIFMIIFRTQTFYRIKIGLEFRSVV